LSVKPANSLFWSVIFLLLIFDLTGLFKHLKRNR